MRETIPRSYHGDFILHLARHDEKRQRLISEMHDLAIQGINCGACSGNCCTFVTNSMQISYLEACIIFESFEEASIPELVESLSVCITRFALDRPDPGNGQRRLTRRHYTCPFFREQKLGCTLATAVKPLGCLAYNPQKVGVKDGEGCHTPTQWQTIESSTDQDPGAQKPATFAGGDERLPIPIAILKIWQEKYPTNGP